MTAYYKAVRPDGTDFRTGTVGYGAALVSGDVIRHPDPDLTREASRYLSVATAATDCTGMAWPCRLLLVEPVGPTAQDPLLPSKVRCESLRVVGERPAHEALGPQGEHVAALIDRCRAITTDQFQQWAAAWDAARDAAWDAARDAARDAAWDAAWAAAWDAARDAAWAAARAAARDAAWAAARDAAWAVIVRDLITRDQYRVLVQVWASVMGWPHPDDGDGGDGA